MTHPGSAREAVLDLCPQEVVEQVVLEPQHHLGRRRVGGQTSVAVAQHRQRGVLGHIDLTGMRPRARGEVPGAHLGERVGVQSVRHRAVMQHVAPDEHVGGSDARRGSDLGHDGIAVGDMQNGKRTSRNARRRGHVGTIRPRDLRSANSSGHRPDFRLEA